MTPQRFALVALALLLCACAPIPPVRRPIDSEPQGAKVYLDGALVGATPTALELDGDPYASRSHILKVTAPGHRAHQQTISNQYQAPQESFGEGFARGLAGQPAPSGRYSWPSNFLIRLVKKDPE